MAKKKCEKAEKAEKAIKRAENAVLEAARIAKSKAKRLLTLAARDLEKAEAEVHESQE